jgi:hypothetical protein
MKCTRCPRLAREGRTLCQRCWDLIRPRNKRIKTAARRNEELARATMWREYEATQEENKRLRNTVASLAVLVEFLIAKNLSDCTCTGSGRE